MFGAQNNNGVETKLCTAVNNAIRARNAAELASIVLLEPPFPEIYHDLIQSLQSNYPQNANNSESRLDQLVRKVVTETAEYEDEHGKPVHGHFSCRVDDLPEGYGSVQPTTHLSGPERLARVSRSNI
jgi:hypothetical protein